MKRFYPLYLAIMGALAAGCATVPQSGESQSRASGGDGISERALPENVSFGDPQGDIMYRLLVAEVAMQRNRPDLAVKYYLEAASATGDPEIAARAVRVASFARADDAALEAAKLWSAADPDNLEARRVVAVLYLRTGQNEAAVESLESLLVLEPESTGHTFLQIGALLRRELDKAVALEVMGNLVANHQDIPEAYFSLANLAVWAGDAELASSSVDRALELDGEWGDAVVLKARILQDQGDMDGAANYLNEYLAAHPKAHSVRLTYARTLVDARRYDDARAEFKKLAKETPNSEDVLYALAMLALQFEDLKEAEDYLGRVYRLGNRPEMAAYYLGQIAERRDAHDEALQWYGKVRGGEFRLDAQLRMAAVVKQTKGLEAGLEHLKSIPVKDAGEMREVYLFEASMLREDKRYEDAFEVYNRALMETPDDTQLLYARALLAERLNKLDVTEADLRKVLEQEPDNVAAINALGYTLADRTERHQEAFELISRAIEMEPNDPAIIDSMGWVHYRLGNNSEALEYLRKAFDKSQDPEIAAHLGEVLWVSGKHDEARKVWNEVLKEKKGENQTVNMEKLRKVMERFDQ